MWDRICATRYGVTDEKLRRFRYGMQVNSLGLTEEQPENNVQRIVLEMLGVTLSKDARARAIQLPCWNEALGLPTPWDQQWSLRIQQVLAYESDLLEYGDLFDGSKVVEAKVAELARGSRGRAAVGARRRRLVRDDRRDEGPARAEPRRTRAPHRVGRPEGRRRERVHRDRAVAARRQRAARRHRDDRPRGRARAGRGARGVAAPHATTTPSTCALERLREGRGHRREPRARDHRARPRRRHGRRVGRRAPRGVRRVPRTRPASARCRSRPGAELRGVRAAGRRPPPSGRPIRILVGKPGLDGHSNGAEQIAVAARDAGMEVVYQGIRLTPAQIAAAARDEDVDIVGLSILSGSHLALCPRRSRLLREAGVDGAGRRRRDHPRQRPGRSSTGRASPGSTLPRTSDSAGIMSEVADLATRASQCSGKGCHPPMRNRMQDPRLLVAVSARHRRARRRCRRRRRRLGRARCRRRARGRARRHRRCRARRPRPRRARTAWPQAEDEIRRVQRELASINAALAGGAAAAPPKTELGPIEAEPVREKSEHAFDADDRPSTSGTSPSSCSSRSPPPAARCGRCRSSCSSSTA